MSITRCLMLPSSLRSTTVWRIRTLGKRSTSSLVKVLPRRLILSIEIVSRPSIVRNPYRSGVGALQESNEAAARKKQITAGLAALELCDGAIVLYMEHGYALLNYRITSYYS